jgi:peptide/nickel transport system ATP-binding protein
MDRAVTDRLLPIKGTPPSLINLPTGCSFHPRCAYEPLTGGRGSTIMPDLVESDPAHFVRCHLPAAQRRRIWATEIKPKLDVQADVPVPSEEMP